MDIYFIPEVKKFIFGLDDILQAKVYRAISL